MGCRSWLDSAICGSPPAVDLPAFLQSHTAHEVLQTEGVQAVHMMSKDCSSVRSCFTMLSGAQSQSEISLRDGVALHLMQLNVKEPESDRVPQTRFFLR